LIVGIILGVVALSQLKQSSQGGRGLAQVGIIVGVVFLVLLVVLLIVYFAMVATAGSGRY
jgi:hypothetical protein